MNVLSDLPVSERSFFTQLSTTPHLNLTPTYIPTKDAEIKNKVINVDGNSILFVQVKRRGDERTIEVDGGGLARTKGDKKRKSDMMEGARQTPTVQPRRNMTTKRVKLTEVTRRALTSLQGATKKS